MVPSTTLQVSSNLLTCFLFCLNQKPADESLFDWRCSPLINHTDAALTDRRWDWIGGRTVASDKHSTLPCTYIATNSASCEREIWLFRWVDGTRLRYCRQDSQSTGSRNRRSSVVWNVSIPRNSGRFLSVIGRSSRTVTRSSASVRGSRLSRLQACPRPTHPCSLSKWEEVMTRYQFNYPFCDISVNLLLILHTVIPLSIEIWNGKLSYQMKDFSCLARWLKCAFKSFIFVKKKWLQSFRTFLKRIIIGTNIDLTTVLHDIFFNEILTDLTHYMALVVVNYFNLIIIKTSV